MTNLRIRLSQSELLELIRFNITEWVDEEVDLNGTADTSREDRLEDAINSFVDDAQEILPYMDFYNEPDTEGDILDSVAKVLEDFESEEV